MQRSYFVPSLQACHLGSARPSMGRLRIPKQRDKLRLIQCAQRLIGERQRQPWRHAILESARGASYLREVSPRIRVGVRSLRHRIAPSLLFRWRGLSSQGALQAVGADESVVPATEYKALQQQVRELQRLLGKKTLERVGRARGAHISTEHSRGSGAVRGGKAMDR